ncbi:hypothetical protein C8Q76DRAFT_767842 [Earliella scabrosa]|nr:hypothetical protein C8Q76DRAFT_767842 [Earliella scabrosa]
MSGRGAYYKALYGGGGRGRGRGRGGNTLGSPGTRDSNMNANESNWNDSPDPAGRAERGSSSRTSGRSAEDLLRVVRALGGRAYPAYRDIVETGVSLRLIVDHVQGDAYAPPSKLRIRVGHAVACFPPSLYENRVRRTALCDYIAREVCARLERVPAQARAGGQGGWAGEKGGEVSVDRPGQEVLERSSVVITPAEKEDEEGGVELRFCVSLPAQGRTILGDAAHGIFAKTVPMIAEALVYASHDARRVKEFVDCVEDQEELRRQITAAGLVAFVPNGAVLPRASGASDAPMSSGSVVTFESPPDLERSFVLPHRGEIRGMGIPRGITMIAGGGFHGKSTLLAALARGCYNHIPGDGREFLVTSAGIASVQSEDGRAITNVDISPFISALPGGRTSTSSFSTEDASGSTSMAAAVIEALELGADVLLFDEDTCATNFLIRDRRMRRLVAADPITPLVYSVRSLAVVRDYCDVADLVLEMRNYKCYNITSAAKRVAEEMPSGVGEHQVAGFGPVRPRQLEPASLPSAETKVTTRTRAAIDIGAGSAAERGTLDLSALGQVVHVSQTRAIASALKVLHARPVGSASLRAVLSELEREMDDGGLDVLVARDRLDGFLARPRAIDLGMAINRLRTVSLRY